jgi:glycosyltransferase involved in cell wall biosynthesis
MMPNSPSPPPLRSDIIRIVTFSSLFPNVVQPTHGIFVENRLRHLVADGSVTSRVIAPVPWFPLAAPIFGRYGEYARVPKRENRVGLTVLHPRFLVIPKFGMRVAPALLFAGTLATFRRLQSESGDFDLIDAHYFYPDGVAAVMLGKLLRKPVVITARGSDINSIPRHALPRRMILYAARNAAAIIAVSQALKDALVGMGVAGDRVRVLRNGVDLAVFRPTDRRASRSKLRLNGLTLLSVGHLIELKGHDLAIGALASLPNHTLLIVGEGPERSALQQHAARLGVSDRVRFLGEIAHRELPTIYSAADALVLASSREGWANVLLESMACGTPVVASNICGNPEVVSQPEAGVLMRERTPEAVAEAVRELARHMPQRTATRRFAEGYSWDATTNGQAQLFADVLATSHAVLSRRRLPLCKRIDG